MESGDDERSWPGDDGGDRGGGDRGGGDRGGDRGGGGGGGGDGDAEEAFGGFE